MKKRLLCVLATAALLLGVLAGCGGSAGNGSSSGNPGVGSTKPNNTDGDPVAVMNERVKAVNDAVNYECVGVEETVESGLLFYSLTRPSSSSREPRDYNPDKPLDYSAEYKMFKAHTEGIVSEDTYAALLKEWNSNYGIGEFSAEDVIETDDLYVYYVYDTSDSFGIRISYCFILVKDTDILYRFTMSESWRKADYYEHHLSDDLKYTDDDAEYISTDEFWKAFAQTAKFAGKADEDFKNSMCVDCSIGSYRDREGYIPISSYDENRYIILDIDDDKLEVRVKVPYIEEWYAGGSYGSDTISEGFEAFLEDSGEEYGSLVIDDFGQGEPTMFFNNGLYKYAGGGEVTLIHDFSDIDDEWMGMRTDADRTRLLLASGDPFGDAFKIVDLKTFEVTDTVYASYDLNADDELEFLGAAINGVSVDEETARAKCDEWYSICDIYLLSRAAIEEIDFDAAWNEYKRRG